MQRFVHEEHTIYTLYSSFLSQIAMDFVLSYRPGRTIPHVRLQIRWGEDENVQMELTGVTLPKSFMLERPENMNTRG